MTGGAGATAARLPLEGVRVVDLSQGVAGPFCARLLADYGATAVKVESPAGDESRRAGPFPGDEPDPECSGLFLHLNTNKRGIVVDSRAPAGVDVVRRLVAAADVVVESARPADVAGTGLEPAALLAGREDLVVTSVTPFGQDGPYRDYRMTEIVAFAMGGPMNSSGSPDREPVKLAGNAVQMQSGATALTATLGALFHAQSTGRGQHVDVATYETQNGSLDRRRYYLLSYQYSGYVTQRAHKVGAGRIAVGGRFPTRDGRMITTGAVWPTHLPRMVSVLGDEELSARFAERGEELIVAQPELVNAAIASWAASRDARAAMREAQSAGWPVVVVNDPKTLLTDEHLVARGFWVEGESPMGPVPHTGAPWKVDGGGWALRAPAPRLGQHTDEVLRETGFDDAAIAGLRAEGVVL
ncbi:CaiB/BaiF CoA transferase family protein [Pseudonocardia lacus]|uniref:CaiB/BaiF CoA transferase family protein n=1 Tax=Pseudonocardia lacus TaxID=2835865 RepID=UPI001BDD38D0|nr:CoA transferase [Pseudonocardia lacus]